MTTQTISFNSSSMMSLISAKSYSDTEMDLVEFYDQLQRDLFDERYEGIVQALDVAIEKHLPAFNEMIRALLFTMKSKCHEELHQYGEALIDIEKAIEAYKAHDTCIDAILIDAMKIDPLAFLQMRKAGLLLLAGKEEEGIALLRQEQPETVLNVLLYRLIEKEKGVSLIVPKTAFDEEDVLELFLSGRYEEVIEKGQSEEETHIRIAALAMLGRVDEAIELYESNTYICSTCDDYNGFHTILNALNGDLEYLDKPYPFEAELESLCPFGPFAKWLLQK